MQEEVKYILCTEESNFIFRRPPSGSGLNYFSGVHIMSLKLFKEWGIIGSFDNLWLNLHIIE
jgi:hypothetical protein